MIRRMAMILSLVVGAGAIGFALGSQPGGNRAEIDEFYAAWMGTAAQKGPAAYATFYAEDGMMLPPMNARLRAAVRSRSSSDERKRVTRTP